jgi:LysM repeat protein
MRRISLLLLVLSCAAAVDAAAQTTPSTRRPPRDAVSTARGDSIRMAEEGVVVSIDALEDEPAADTVPEPKPGPYARAGGTGPFTVQASGEPAPRPERGAVVWVDTPRPSATRDTARTGGQRVTSGQTTRRDTASTPRPASRDTARTGGQRVASGQTARRDTASTSRPTPRDTVRIGAGRVTSGQAARRDSATSTRPAARDTARRTSPAASTTTRPGANTTAGARARSHTVASGETFYGIARRYGVTAAQLRALNPDVDMDALEVGDVLRLPAGARDSRASTQPPRPATTNTQGRTGTSTPTPPRGSRAHTVEAGETLFGIARRYGVTVAAIRQANGMESDQVRAGQRLVIPPAR